MSELTTYRPHAERWLQANYGEYSKSQVESLTYLLAGCAADGENIADRARAELAAALAKLKERR